MGVSSEYDYINVRDIEKASPKKMPGVGVDAINFYSTLEYTQKEGYRRLELSNR